MNLLCRRGFLLRVFVLIGSGFAPVVAHAAELLVADRATNRILAFDPTSGAFSRVVVPQDPTNLFSPAAMTIGFGGDLFVASQGTGKVLRYDIATGAPKGNTPGSPVFADLGLPSGPSGLSSWSFMTCSRDTDRCGSDCART
jgi:hypothetical protein